VGDNLVYGWVTGAKIADSDFIILTVNAAIWADYFGTKLTCII